LDEIVKAGKVRFVGLSDDTAWGMMKYLELSDKHALPRMHSIQNEFSLLNRSDDPYIAEVCVREDIAYLPWSPLACGLLSGKYANGNVPKGSRWDVEKKMRDSFDSFRNTDKSHVAVQEYLEIAKKYGLKPTEMALKFVDAQSFVTSTIIGATNMEQLKSNIDAFSLTLDAYVMKDIDAVYRKCPIPY
jgi:aryl-alcohol dehydrogenase-like predicted oxidoreductase